MFDAAISQLTTPRWELPRELSRLTANGLEAISIWRAKLTDIGVGAAAAELACSGARVSSLQWAGGFTGGDGRTFAESVEDAVEAIETAASLAAPVLVLHSGCRGGHTRTHAMRLLGDALALLAPVAGRAGVALAIRPLHPAASVGCNFLNRLAEAVELVESFADPAVRLALDLWQFGDDADLPGLLPRLAAVAAIVQVADRLGPHGVDAERLPAGEGDLRLRQSVGGLLLHGYDGDFEFDPVGQTVESAGYEEVIRGIRRTVDAWAASLDVPSTIPGRGRNPAHPQTWGDHFRPPAVPAGTRAAVVGSLRSQASSQTVSRG